MKVPGLLTAIAGRAPRFRIAGHRLRIAAAVALTLGMINRADAQTVRGVVVRAGTPIPGVVVQLIDSTAAIVARTLSDDAGTYRLIAPRAGTYRIATRRIGFAPTTSSTIVLNAGETREQQLRVDGIAVSLDTVRVRGSRASCAKADATNTEVAAIWEQARTSLMATEASLGGRPMSASLLNYQRTRSGDGTQTLQALSMLEMDSVAQPWTSPSWTELQKTGYIVVAKDSTVFRAPGLDVLISNEFADANCFRVVASKDSAHVALAFQPAKPKRGISELRGTLTLDRRSNELRSLDFGYTNISSVLDEAGAGGRMEFVALRDGGWAIGRWNIRMPVMGSIPNVARTSVRVLPLVTSTEIGGGDLLVARRGADTLFARALPLVEGSVIDSVSGAPVRNAHLRLRGLSNETLADSAGKFEFSGVLPGDYTVLINTPSLDSLGAVTSVPLLVADTMARLVVRVPNAQRVLPLVCGVSVDSLQLRSSFGVVRGFVRPATDTVLTTSIDLTIQWRDSVSKNISTRKVRADVSGRYRACDIPLNVALDVRAESGALSGVAAPAQLSATSPFGQIDVVLERMAPNQAVIRGVITDAAGVTIDNATVEIAAAGVRAVTDVAGAYRLSKVPAGKQRLTIRRLGFSAIDADLIVEAGKVMEQPFTLTKVTTLSEVTTTASTAWIKDFDENRRIGLGQFVTRDQLAKQESQRLSEIFAMMRGVKLVRGKGTAAYVSSSRGTRSVSGGACFAQVFLDDKPMYMGRAGEPPPNINEFLALQLEAVEYFAGPSETPAKYSALNSGCGVIVLHTRQTG